MDAGELALASLSRILHVTTAIVLVGGTFFVRFVLMPAASSALANDVHDRLRAAVISGWKKFVHGGIGLFLLTGGYNYYRVIVSGEHKGDALYHALLGTKIFLALFVFFIASALVGRSAGFENLRRDARRWLAINILVALATVAISGFLKVRGVRPTSAKVATATTEGADAAISR